MRLSSSSAQAEARSPDGWTRTMRYVMERKRVEEALGFLSHTGTLLEVPRLDLREAIEQVADSALRFRASWCRVDVFDPAGLRTTVTRRDPTVSDAMATRLDRSAAAAECDERMECGADPAPAGTGIAALISAGLTAESERVGTLAWALAENNGRNATGFTPSDAAVLKELARQLSQRLLIERLYRRIAQGAD